MRARKTVRQHTIPLEHAVALLRLEPEQQIALAEEQSFTMAETKDRVRGLLGRTEVEHAPTLKGPAVYDRLIRIAPEEDVAELLKQAVENLMQGIPQ